MDTSQMTCPKCGWARDPGAVECPACGIVYARYTGAPRRPSPAGTDAFAPPPPPLPSAEDLNPYAPPQSNLQSSVEPAPGQMFSMFQGDGVWYTGNLLVMQKGASLPNRCLVCNQPASVQFPKKLYWHHPAIYLLLLLNALIYIVVALIARKKAEVVLPLCTEHAEKRKRAATIGTLLILLGFVAMLGSCTQADNSDTFAMILGLGSLILFVGLIVLAVGANIIAAKRIDDYYIWLKKVGSPYLATLPPAPPGL